MKTYPLSQSQLGVLIECMEHPESTQYNLPYVTRLSNRVDAENLRSAIKRALNTDVAFYTRIFEQDGEYRQYADMQTKIDIPIALVDENKIRESIQQFIRPFDLLNDCLTRIKLIKTSESLYFLLDMHHIITDGSSVMEIFDDIDKAYNGQKLTVHTKSIYEYAEKEISNFGSEEYLKAASYYKNLFQGITMTALPGKLNDEVSVCNQVSSYISRTEVNDFCQQNKVKPNLLFMSALELVLSRITREDTVAYTTSYHGRNDKEFKNAIGLFVKTIPFAMEIKEGTNVLEFIHGHEEKWEKSKAYQVYPFVHFCRDFNQTSRIGFSFQGSKMNEQKSFLGEVVSHEQYGIGTTIDSTIIQIYENIDNYEIRIRYASSKFTHVFMDGLINSINACIINFINNFGNQLKDISLTNSIERKKLLDIGRGRILKYDHNETFVDLFLRQASEHPKSTAVVDEINNISYEELNHRSDILAYILREKGVEADSFVGLMLPRRKGFLVSVIGVFKAGGAYVPLDSDYPNDRLLYMLEDSGAKILITTHELYEEKCKVGNFHEKCILFLDDINWNNIVEPVNEAKSRNLAYMIYTSGSTGKPKGVMIEHKSLRLFVGWRAAKLELSYNDHIAQHASFSFDASLDDLLTPLTVGAQVHILSSTIRQDMREMYQYFYNNKIAGIALSAQLGMEMLNSYDLPLRFLSMGGEALKLTKPSPVKVINEYGPTEFTVCSSFHIVDNSCEYTNIPIGRPVPNSLSVIVDGCGNLLPHGVAGELCLIGTQMARGYWKRDDLTAKAFVPCPFIPGERMYHTGDLVRWNDNNELEYLGRIDNQVKLRGFRIELGEIESCALSYGSIIKSAVAEVKNINGIDHLCLYYTSDANIDEEGLKVHMSQSLTEYMVPDVFVKLDEMPLTPNGKINRKKLPLANFKIRTENIEPADVKEQILFKLVCELLCRKDFGVTDDLKSLGLTSLLAMKLTAMSNNLGISLKASDVMRKNTIRNILNGESHICYWANQYKAEKPVVVLFYFLTPYNLLVPLRDKLSEKFSVLMVESISDHFEYLFKGEDLNEVIEMYSVMIGLYIKEGTKVHAFVGHCLAGEVAFRLSALWQKNTGETIPVVMLNTNGFEFHRNEKYEEFINGLPERFQRKHSKELELKLRDGDIVTSLIVDNEPPVFGGRVLYYKAMKKSPMSFEKELMEDGEFDFLEKQKQNDNEYSVDYVGYWKQFAPNLKYKLIDAEHFGMLDEKFVDKYVDDILDL